MDHELIEHLDRRFEEAKQHVDRRFEQVDLRFEETKGYIDGRLEEAKRYFGVLAEDLTHKVQLVAEGVGNLQEQFTRHREEVAHEFRETQAMSVFRMRTCNAKSMSSANVFLLLKND